MTYRHDDFEHIAYAARRAKIRATCHGLPKQDVFQVSASYEDYGSGDGEYALFICSIIGVAGEDLQFIGNYHETHRTDMNALVTKAAWELFAVTEKEAMIALTLYEPDNVELWYHFRDLYMNRPKQKVEIDTEKMTFE